MNDEGFTDRAKQLNQNKQQFEGGEDEVDG